MRNLKEFLRDFAGRRVLVVGDLMLDIYTTGTCRRLAPEVSAPVLNADQHTYYLGGAANLAANVAALGASVSIAGVTGNDTAGRQIREMLVSRGIDVRMLRMADDRTTITKHRFSSGGQTFLRVDEGCELPLDGHHAAHLSANLKQEWPDFDGILLSDYGKGCFVQPVIDQIAACQQDKSLFLAVDSKEAWRFRPLCPSMIKPNFEEAQVLLGREVSKQARITELQATGAELRERTGAEHVFLTLDESGCMVFSGNQLEAVVPALRVQNPQVSGAGDTFTGAAALALICAATPAEAATIGTQAASVVLTKSGTACCAPAELLAAGAPAGKDLAKNAVLALLEQARAAGKRIVFTNGCFDILHSGHVRYLQQAREMGDLLVVGLNRDDSIRRLKGSDRPVNSLSDRMEVLSSLSCVNYVIPFGSLKDDTPCSLIKQVRPDVFVKGGDYKGAVLPEQPLLEQLGAEIAFIPVVSGRSTSAVIKKIAAAQFRNGWATIS
ncbi:D-glycero-beta-D-manno-heptose 1-phosphate adenylyltransferase [Pedobacter sp. SYP-B3415]|uniref:D-glycero-beta-D-manno-heptose 1-phosphate adenylyltransferase n=1 Tax=Pedobacter sp. SYP-B3415 TaxID=2496641 RepID=UPI00101DFA08|nr:D-glycero-beta-D-manno-heptose 1-phosphate adenylyltransferase [Pedobacter sp. SYP-B3415]